MPDPNEEREVVCWLSKPSVVYLGFHGSTCVLISMSIACDIHVFLAQASRFGFLSLVNKDFHYCCVFGV